MNNVVVPLMNCSVTPETQDFYLQQFKDANTDKVLFITFGYAPDPEIYAEDNTVILDDSSYAYTFVAFKVS